MNISQAKDSIKQIFKTDSVTALISERGVGKTSAFKQCAEEMGIGYIDLYAAALEGPDFMGLPHKDLKRGLTTYLAPNFLPTKEAIELGLYPSQGLLVLEELNRVSQDTTSVLYPLLLDRRINGHDLAPGWRLGVTMNPDNLNYVVNTLDDAMLDRFVSIFIEPDVDEYINFSIATNGNNSVLEYLKMYPDMLLIIKKESNIISKGPSPRGWSKVQEIISKCNFTEDILSEVLSGVIGSQGAISYLNFVNNKIKLPSVERIISNYSIIRPEILELIENKNFDVISAIILSLVSRAKDKNEELDQINLFLLDIPKEFKIKYFKDLSLRDKDLFVAIASKLDVFSQVSDDIIDLLG